MKTRKLKVHESYYDYTPRSNNRYERPKPVPYVLLKGYWLQKINFDIGKAIKVEVKENQLTLTLEEAN